MNDLNSAYKLYRNSKEYDLWSISEDLFISILGGTHKNDIRNTTKVFYKYDNNSLIGYLSAKIREGKGVICFIFIKEDYRNKGIGRELVNQALEYFKTNCVSEINFGAGAGSYFFPGLPKNLQCEFFFNRLGFTVKDEGCVDMYQDISNWEVPAGVFDVLEKENVKIQYANKEVANDIANFAKENFPNWYEYYKSDMEEEKYDKVFYASIEEEIAGISKLWVGDCNWDLLFESNVGGGGALGVSKKLQGKGIGLAMKAWGTEIIKEKGIKYVWIGWTYAIDFYKKLGFKVWREYISAKLKLK